MYEEPPQPAGLLSLIDRFHITSWSNVFRYLICQLDGKKVCNLQTTMYFSNLERIPNVVRCSILALSH